MRDSSQHRVVLFCSRKIGSLHDAIAGDDMVAVVRKCIARFQKRKLTNDSIALDHSAGAVLPSYNPLSAANSHGNIGLVMYGNVVDKRERTLLWSVQVRRVNHLIHGYPQSFEFGNHVNRFSQRSSIEHCISAGFTAGRDFGHRGDAGGGAYWMIYFLSLCWCLV